MKFNVALLVSLCIVGVLGAKEIDSKTEKKAEPKPKREAPISGGGGYHGPSFKYLPPSSSVPTGGFDGYSSSHHSGSEGLSGYDFGSSGLGANHGHGDAHFGSSGPKVETYIVQTETAQGNYGRSQGLSSHGLTSLHGFGGGSPGLSGLNSFSSSHGSSGSHNDVGYKYAGSSTSFGSGHSGYQNSFGGSQLHGHSPVHKIKAIVIPANGFSTDGHSTSGYNRFGGRSGGYSYTNGLGGGSHYANDVSGGYAGHSSGLAGGHTSTYLSGSDFSGAQGSQSYETGNEYSAHGLEASYRDSDHILGQSGYSYESPSSTYSHSHSHSAPSNSYGAPGISSSSYHSGNFGHQAPAYAAGHKGLGHFGFAASKPQALNTNFIDSSRYGGSHASQAHNNFGHAHKASNAPFKPSLFLGASHEGSSSGGSISSEYGPPAGGPGISAQYLPPPTSDGYDYPPPSALYGAPSDGASSGDLQEPENSYLPPSPPQTSYGPPATPNDSYLPPHH